MKSKESDYTYMGPEIHIAKDTNHGVRTLCGKVNALAVYPSELQTYSTEAVCEDCKAHGGWSTLHLNGCSSPD